MESSIHPEETGPSDLAKSLSLDNPRVVLVAFAASMVVQVVGFVIWGTGRTSQGMSGMVLVVQNVLAIACAWIAFRRARRVAAIFWFLHAVSMLMLLIPTAFGTYAAIFDRSIVSPSTWRVLFCLYGAPVLMMLFLPETDRDRSKSEIFLDLFQVAIVVGLSFSTFFLLPVQQLMPADALLRNVSLSNLQSFFLLAAVVVRVLFARVPGTRDLLLRLGIFLVVCAIVTFLGNWIDLHQYRTASSWFDLGWDLPYVAGGLVALTWRAPAVAPPARKATGFWGLLGVNVVLVTLLFCCIALLMGRWKAAQSETLTTIAVVASLLAFTVRLALTQHHQQEEITQRKAAQDELLNANKTISGLLEIADLEVTGITQISELGSLLQACASRDEALRIIPERLARLFPGTSGALSVLNASKDRAESAARWGARSPLDQTFAPDECWSLRRGCTHAVPALESSLRCAHLQSQGSSICMPLIANGEAIGVLSIQDDEPQPNAYSAHDADAFARRNQLARAVAEHIALAISNLNLREALRLQAIRDPLTGLYNRRYMQEFLEREICRARRKSRPLAVMMLDLDNFKLYNDTFGHPAGDEALRFVGATLLRTVRSEDLACRYGGEEFALILPECSLEQAALRAEEIRVRLKELHTERVHEIPGMITVSIGVAGFEETTDHGNLLLKFADDALYRAKHTGRNRVVVAQPDPDRSQKVVSSTIFV